MRPGKSRSLVAVGGNQVQPAVGGGVLLAWGKMLIKRDAVLVVYVRGALT